MCVSSVLWRRRYQPRRALSSDPVGRRDQDQREPCLWWKVQLPWLRCHVGAMVMGEDIVLRNFRDDRESTFIPGLASAGTNLCGPVEGGLGAGSFPGLGGAREGCRGDGSVHDKSLWQNLCEEGNIEYYQRDRGDLQHLYVRHGQQWMGQHPRSPGDRYPIIKPEVVQWRYLELSSPGGWAHGHPRCLDSRHGWQQHP